MCTVSRAYKVQLSLPNLLYSKMMNTFLLYDGIALNANDDLNDYLETGNYYCGKDVTAKTLINCPCNVAFTMKILRSTGLFFPAQLIIEHMTGTIYYRMYDTTYDLNTWRSWSKIESVAI